MANKKIFGFVIFVLIIILTTRVFALGVSPGRTTLDYAENIEKETSFSIINSENKNMNVAFTIQGELASSIIFEDKVASFSSDEKSKTFGYKVNLPSGLAPGLHTAEIVATELPENLENPNMVIKATVSVVTQLYVYVPYPGKYLDTNFNIVSNEGSNLISFYIPLISRGKEGIESARAAVTIYKGKEIATSFKTNEKTLKSGERAELSAVWDPNVIEGEYSAVAEINYDGEILRQEKKFSVGKENIKFLDISTNEFHLGDVARIKILVQNKIGDTANQVSANLKVYNSELKSIADLKSESYEILPQENKEMIVYWDTEKIEKGEYTSNLKIDYNKKFVNKNFKMNVKDDAISFEGVGFAISSGNSRKISTTTILVIVIGILILINVLWFVVWMRKKKKIKRGNSNVIKVK